MHFYWITNRNNCFCKGYLFCLLDCFGCCLKYFVGGTCNYYWKAYWKTKYSNYIFRNFNTIYYPSTMEHHLIANHSNLIMKNFLITNYYQLIKIEVSWFLVIFLSFLFLLYLSNLFYFFQFYDCQNQFFIF